jgi:hypothetical protein
MAPRAAISKQNHSDVHRQIPTVNAIARGMGLTAF